MPREARQELGQAAVGTHGYVDRGVRLERREDPGLEDGGLRERQGQRGGEPAGVAPRRAGGDAVGVEDGDRDALLLEIPRGGETDDAGADDDHVLGFMCHASQVW